MRDLRVPMLVAAGLSVAALLGADAASAQYYYPTYDRMYSPYWGGSRWDYPPRPYYQKPKRKPAEAPKKEVAAPVVAKPSQPLLIAISIRRQRLTLYSGGTAISHSSVSTGTASHPTPTGIFSVIGKERFHRSNLYSDAPMPFMQRITWSGVALHQGVLPGYPASHGCIRLPERFAQSLYATTRMGVRVIISDDEVTPYDIAHPKLFAPKPKEEPAPEVASAPRVLLVAERDDPVSLSDAARPAGVAEAELAVLRLKGGPDAAAAEPRGGRNRPGAELSDRVDARPVSASPVDGAPAADAAGNASRPGRVTGQEVKEVPRKSDPVSVFISRKTGRLYVRQAFEPLFDTPVTIRDPDQPLGTHLYTAVAFTENKKAMEWVAVTLSGNGAAQAEVARIGSRRERGERRREHEEPAAHVSTATRLAAAAALDRVEMPQEALDRITELLSPGASLIISDLPLSHETGKYTDFIVLTK